jgi:hypothetical protein
MSDTSDLIRDLNERKTNPVRQQCSLTRIKNGMSNEERKAVENAEQSIREDSGNGRAKSYSATWLSEVLTKNGHPISPSTISRHINGRCGCE